MDTTAMDMSKRDVNGDKNKERTKLTENDSLTKSPKGTSSICESEFFNHDIISEEMVKEEHQLEQQALLEEQKLRQKTLEEDKKMAEENCFKRLRLLLSRSSIYAKFMAAKLEKRENIQLKKKSLKEKQNFQNELPPVLSNNDEHGHRKRKAICSKPSAKRLKNEVEVLDVFKKNNLANMTFEEPQNDSVLKNNSNSLDNSNFLNRQPKLLYGGIMRSYQLEGFEWLKTLFENGVNGILADEMGLGKTIQSIAFIAYLIEMGIPGPFFVCAPLSTLPNWCLEFRRFTPDIPIVLYHGLKDEREALRSKIQQKVKVRNFFCYPVIITSYNIALVDASKISRISWKMLIIDEAHRIKNFQCKLIKALKKFNVAHRLLLTGTPLQNNLTELWSLLNFILPEIFDDLEVFQSWFDISKLSQSGATQEIIAREQEKQIVSMIHEILTPFLLRRMKSDVEFTLPPKKEVIVHAPLTNLQQKYYTAVLNDSIRKMFDVDKEYYPLILSKRQSKQTNFLGVGNENSSFTSDITQLKSEPLTEEETIEQNISELHIKLTNIEMCLRKICNHPYLISYPVDVTQDYRVDEDIVKTSGKLLVLDAMLQELNKRGHKVLIFSQFVSMLNIIQDYCVFRNYKFARLDGQMHLSDRQDQLEYFEKESTFLFLISTKAGGLGLNLVSADTVIIYDSDYNPQCDLQAQDRCHRIGQTKPVVVYRIIVPNTVDEKITNFATSKRKLEKIIIKKGRFNSKDKTHRAITKEELLELLESSDSSGFVKTNENSILSHDELEKLLDRSDMK